MAENNDKKVLLSLKDVDVKFNVRGRTLSAIRNVSLDIYEHESIAIVGESGSGKSVLTKTFAGMLDSNGFISNGTIIFSDDEISKTDVSTKGKNGTILKFVISMLNKLSRLESNAANVDVTERNKKIAYGVLLSIGRYPLHKQIVFLAKLYNAFRIAMKSGADLTNPNVLNKIFEVAVFRVEFREYDEANNILHGYAIIDCAKVKYTNDWQKIRGCRIATVFQDPMTSLNPVLTIGKQIMTVILKHQKCMNAEAKKRTIDIMRKVGITEPEKRFNDYPFEYSGGMRQRIVIAIALSCQPKILICDEPTTALDVTIQAQIIRLIKDLQKELGFTTVYITHDLGVVANVAERVAVLYAGQIVEVGTVEEIFYEPRHPYTWALLSSLPQLAERGEDLFSIPGTPPSLYTKIKGDAFAPRNKYCLAVDLVAEAPIFKISPTHWAKTWLLDPRSPKVEMPENIRNLHEKMLNTFIEFDDEGFKKETANE